MDIDALYASVSAAVRRLNEAGTRTEQEAAATRAEFTQLVEILVGLGVLNDGHRRHLERIGQMAVQSVSPRVRLRLLVDKYALVGPDIDCASRVHLCQVRCCALSFELTTQDVEEGVVRWELQEPYLIRHERDGFCTHMDRQTKGCTTYAQRPAACRTFDCRSDPRIWLDFDQRIPAPLAGS